MYRVGNLKFTSLPKEETEQQELCRYLRKNNIFFYATVNENTTSNSNRNYALKVEAKNKKMGKRKGVSDLTIFLDDVILFIELKRQRPILKNGNLGTPKNKPSDEQLDFLENANKYKYAMGFVAYGCNEAIEIINKLQKETQRQNKS